MILNVESFVEEYNGKIDIFFHNCSMAKVKHFIKRLNCNWKYYKSGSIKWIVFYPKHKYVSSVYVFINE